MNISPVFSPPAPVPSRFWLVVLACVLALAWLLPNHYPPWAAFHSDAWTAAALALAALFVVVRVPGPVEWQPSTVLTAVLVLVPWIQFAAEMLPFAGQAWISAAYLLGFLVAVLTGQRWERSRTGQAGDYIFLAIGVASVVSVNLQLRTWLGLMGSGLNDIWSMGLVGERPYANIGQPNQLGTLLLWGLLAIGWAFQTRRLRAAVAVFGAGFLLFGIALTQSRTAWLGLSFIVAMVWIWRRHWVTRSTVWGVSGLFVFFWCCPLLLRWLNRALLLATEPSYFRVHFEDETRHIAARVFLSAALERPWAGYGWTEIAPAQLSVAADHPAMRMVYGHSHNLFLDLILWVGLPLGLLIGTTLLIKLWRFARAVNDGATALLVMLLGVVGIHAMVELPLQYAYFLLPAGLAMGLVNARCAPASSLVTPRWTLAALWLLAVFLLGGIVRDYFRVEANFQVLRFEQARIRTVAVPQAPEVVFLTQLRERIRLQRYTPHVGMSEEELIWIQQATSMYPSPGLAYRTAMALALNGRGKEAGQWLVKACKIGSQDECDLIRRAWEHDAKGDPRFAVVPWPR